MPAKGEGYKIQAFLRARRIAFIGVSAISVDATRQVFRALAVGGREVIPIRAGVDEIEGQHAYARLEDVPGAVEGALIMTCGASRIVEHCAEYGIERIWVATGTPLQPEARELCDGRDIDVITTPFVLEHVQAWHDEGWRGALHRVVMRAFS